MPETRIEGSFDKQIRGIEMEVERVQRKLVMDIFNGLYQPGVSAIFSGYYKSNHRVMVGRGANARLSPAQRPRNATQFQFIDNVETARSEGLGKLDDIKIGSKTKIGTAVPYALEREAIDGTYQKAADIGLSKVDVVSG